MRQLLVLLLQGGDLAALDAADGAPLWTAPGVLPMLSPGGSPSRRRPRGGGAGEVDVDDDDTDTALTTALHLRSGERHEVWVSECMRLVAPRSCENSGSEDSDSEGDDAITVTRRDGPERFTQCVRQRSVPIGLLDGETDDLDEAPPAPVRVCATRADDGGVWLRLDLVPELARGSELPEPTAELCRAAASCCVRADGSVDGPDWDAEAPQMVVAAWLVSVSGDVEDGEPEEGGEDGSGGTPCLLHAPVMLPVRPPRPSQVSDPGADGAVIDHVGDGDSEGQTAVAVSRDARLLSIFAPRAERGVLQSEGLLQVLEEIAIEDGDSEDSEDGTDDDSSSTGSRPWWLLRGCDVATGGGILRTCAGLAPTWLADAIALVQDGTSRSSSAGQPPASNVTEPLSATTKQSSSFCSVLEMGESTKIDSRRRLAKSGNGTPSAQSLAVAGAMVARQQPPRDCGPSTYTGVVRRLMHDPQVLQILSSYSPTAPLGQRTWDMFVSGTAASAPTVCRDGSLCTPADRLGANASSPATTGAPGSATFAMSNATFASAAGSTGSTASSASSQSHFLEHYDPLGYVGRGADGQVIKARHRLTLATYAVKIVPVMSDEHARAVQQEVQILAQLSHKNLVRYFHCWLEDVPAAALLRLERIARSFVQSSDPEGADVADDDTTWGGDDMSDASSAGISASAFNTPGLMSANVRDWSSVARAAEKSPLQPRRPATGSPTPPASAGPPPCSDTIPPTTPGGALSESSPLLATPAPNLPPASADTATDRDVTRANGALVPFRRESTVAPTNGAPGGGGGPAAVRFISEVTTAADAMLPVRVLFIQMEHFPMSLHDVIAARNPRHYPLSASVTPPATPLRELRTALGPAAAAAAFTRSQMLERQRNLTILLDVLTALAFLHEKGIVHRDIKPANIFVDPASMHTCVGDFGLSKAADDTDSDDDDRTTALSNAPTPGSITKQSSVHEIPTDAGDDLGGSDTASPTTATVTTVTVADADGLTDAEAAEAETQLENSFATVSAPNTPTAPGVPTYVGAATGTTASAAKRQSKTLASPTTVSSAAGSAAAIQHTAGVGSPLYAAPEQMLGKRCDSLCDAFAVGIVFVELYHAFATVSERIAVLKAAGRGHVDAPLLQRFPELKIAALLASPSRRHRLSVVQARKLVRTALLKISVELDDDEQ